jgi:hypothetical protein
LIGRTGAYHQPAVHADILTPDQSNPDFYCPGCFSQLRSVILSSASEADRFGPSFAYQYHLERREKKLRDQARRDRKWFCFSS